MDPEHIRKRLGILGEPMVLGTFLGVILGAIAFLPPAEGTTLTEAICKILQTAINLGAVLMLLPKMVAILMEGLMAVSEVAREFMAKRFEGRELHLGLDAAILIGHPSALAASLILIPITIFLAIILPGNRMMPFADLAAIPFFVALLVPITRGNVIRLVILGMIGATAGLYMASWMAPIQTEVAIQSGIATIPEGASMITSMGDGWVTSTWALLMPAKSFGAFPGLLWVLAVIVIIVVMFYALNKNMARWERLAGAVEEVE